MQENIHPRVYADAKSPYDSPMRHDYSPFEKTFDQVTVDDLTALQSVAEGWYIEYKQQLAKAGSIAKSVSAFANTYGGWLFYGIVEKSKDDPVAGTFPGIDRAEADAALQSIRQGVANHVQPSPFFRAKALFGPSEALGLPEDRCIVMVQIPWGADAPFLHKEGRIYRRVGDGSEPKAENDRFVLDQLSTRATKITDRYAEWTNRELELSEAEEEAPYLRIFLIADFWEDHPELRPASLRSVRDIMKNGGEAYSTTFETVHRTAGGIVCRQTSNVDPSGLSLTWLLSNDLRSEIIVPLSKYRADDLDVLRAQFDGYDHIDRFIDICRKQRFTTPTVIALNILLLLLFALGRKQVALAEAFGWTGPVFAKVHLHGVWRTVPFFDAPHVLDEFEQHGIALTLRDEITLHRGKAPASYIELAAAKGNDIDAFALGTALFLHIAAALGISSKLGIEDDESQLTDGMLDLMEAGNRALEAQKLRVAKKR